MSISANPKRIGYIVNYGTHEWYQNVIFGLQSRADELGIELEVMDANLDINKQTQQAEDFMTKGVDVLIMTPVNEEGVVPILRTELSNTNINNENEKITDAIFVALKDPTFLMFFLGFFLAAFS